MADLGPLELKLTAEGLAELLSALKNVENMVVRITSKEKERNTAFVKQTKEENKAIKEAQQELKSIFRQRAADEKEQTNKLNKEFKQRAADEKESIKAARDELKETYRFRERSERDLTRKLKEENRQRANDYNRYIGKPLGTMLQRGSQTMGLMAGGAAAFASGDILKTAYTQEMDLHKVLGQVVRSSNIPGGNGPVIKYDELSKEVRSTSQELGMNPTEVAQGYLALSRHGRPELAKTFGKDIARWSFAEDISADDLSDTLQGFARQNPKASNEELRTLMMHTIGQGKQFNLPINEMSGALGEATASASLFGKAAGSQAFVQNQLAGLMQVARQGGANTAPEAAMGIKSFYGEIAKAAGTPKRLAKAGLTKGDILDKDGQLLPANQILETVLAKTKGQIDKLEGIVSQRGMRLVQGLLPTYKTEGMAGVDKQLTNVERSTASEDLIKQDIAERQKDETIQIEMQRHINELAVNINQHFPAITKAIDTLGGVADKMGAIGLGLTAIGGTALGSGVGAGIGNLLRNMVTANMSVRAANVNVIGGGALSNIVGGAGMTPVGGLLSSIGGAAGAGATALGGALTVGAGTLAIGSIAAAVYETIKAKKEAESLTDQQYVSGSAAQFASNKYDQQQHGDVLDRFLVGMGSLLVKVTNIGVDQGKPSVAGPMGPNLPGANK